MGHRQYVPWPWGGHLIACPGGLEGILEACPGRGGGGGGGSNIEACPGGIYLYIHVCPSAEI